MIKLKIKAFSISSDFIDSLQIHDTTGNTTGTPSTASTTALSFVQTCRISEPAKENNKKQRQINEN